MNTVEFEELMQAKLGRIEDITRGLVGLVSEREGRRSPDPVPATDRQVG